MNNYKSMMEKVGYFESVLMGKTNTLGFNDLGKDL